MRNHVDWLTFTIPMVYFGTEDDAYASAINNGFTDLFGDALRDMWLAGAWQSQERSRAPYSDAWVMQGDGITLFASPNLTHACVEVSGQGCERLIKLGVLNDVISACTERITRIDIACDIETTTKPQEFVKVLSHARMRTSGQVVSDTGETCYVGSQKSERYARVYRYNKPHPRSHLLRIEHVFRKEYAKKVAAALVSEGMAGVAAAAGNVFGWSHEIWQPAVIQSAEISVVYEHRTTGKTVFWLVNSCASAFKRLCADGTISDPEEFLKRYFMPHDNT